MLCSNFSGLAVRRVFASLNLSRMPFWPLTVESCCLRWWYSLAVFAGTLRGFLGFSFLPSSSTNSSKDRGAGSDVSDFPGSDLILISSHLMVLETAWLASSRRGEAHGVRCSCLNDVSCISVSVSLTVKRSSEVFGSSAGGTAGLKISCMSILGSGVVICVAALTSKHDELLEVSGDTENSRWDEKSSEDMVGAAPLIVHLSMER